MYNLHSETHGFIMYNTFELFGDPRFIILKNPNSFCLFLNVFATLNIIRDSVSNFIYIIRTAIIKRLPISIIKASLNVSELSWSQQRV